MNSKCSAANNKNGGKCYATYPPDDWGDNNKVWCQYCHEPMENLNGFWIRKGSRLKREPAPQDEE